LEADGPILFKYKLNEEPHNLHRVYVNLIYAAGFMEHSLVPLLKLYYNKLITN